jgi:hypothetical protein
VSAPKEQQAPTLRPPAAPPAAAATPLPAAGASSKRGSDGADAIRARQGATATAGRVQVVASSSGPTTALIAVLFAGLALVLAALVADAVVALGKLPPGALNRSRTIVACVGVTTAFVAFAALLAAA